MESPDNSRVANFRKIAGTNCFRMSKPDTESEVSFLLEQQKVKTIIDLRSEEYDTFSSIMDTAYPPHRLEMPINEAEDKPRVVPMSGQKEEPQKCTGEDRRRCRVAVPIVHSAKLVKFYAWYVRLLLRICLFIDRLFGTRLVLFATLQIVVRPRGESFLPWLLQIELTEYGPQIASILHLLCQPEHTSAAIMCSLGKDRTGLLSALISHICGCSKQEILNDYSLSEKLLPSSKGALRLYRKFKVLHIMGNSVPAHLIEMFAFIEKRYGSLDTYLESIGFGEEDQERMRKNIMSKD